MAIISMTIKKIPTENQELIAFCEWLSYHPVLKSLPIKIQNEGKRSPYVGAMLKRQGLHPGASDIFIPFPCKCKHGLFIEMKRTKGGIVSQPQKDFINMMLLMGYEAKVTYGCDEAIRVVKDYLN